MPVEPHGQHDHMLNPWRSHTEVEQCAGDPPSAPITAGLDAQLVKAWYVAPPILGRGEDNVGDDQAGLV